jgi:putative endonuclease
VPAGNVGPAHLALGQAGEDAAADLLRRSGFRILERNWRSGGLELDIVCEQGDTLVFVEVKTRAAEGLANPEDALTPAKRRKLSKAIGLYLSARDLWDRSCRVDLVSVVHGPRGLSVTRHEDVLDFSQDASGAAWQPW